MRARLLLFLLIPLFAACSTQVVERAADGPVPPANGERVGDPPGEGTVVGGSEMSSVAPTLSVERFLQAVNAEDLEFKGFIPAVFARLANEKFGEEMADKASIKVTAPKELVRNRKARPDEWENEIITNKFQNPQWPIGQAFYENTEANGKPAFRMLIPEYYSKSCLTCHGSPKGETDVTGFPKEGGRAGELAGAISITLYK